MRNKRRYCFGIVLTVLVLMSLSGVCYGEENSENETDGQMLTIGVTLASSMADYQKSLAEALTLADEKDSSCELLIRYADWDAKLQEEQIREFLEEDVDAVILCPVDAKSFLNVLKDAKAAGVPVVDLNMKLDMISSEYIATYVGASMAEEADLAAGYVIDTLGEQGGTVGIIEGAPGSDPQIYRTQTFIEQLTSHPEITVAGILNGAWSREKAALVAYDLITKNRELDIIYCHDSNMAIGVYEMMEQMGKEGEIRIIGIGSNDEYLDALKDGMISAIVTQPIQYEAQYALSCAKRAAKGETLRSWYKNSVELLTIENIDDYSEADYINSLY